MSKSKKTSRTARRRKSIRLKDVAEHVGMSTATVSLVLNRAPLSELLRPETQNRVLAAAEELGYRPNLLARSLRKQRTHSIGVLVPEISEGYASEIMRGVENHLQTEEFVYLLASHRSQPELLEKYVTLLQDRLVEGLIVLAARLEKSPDLPTIAVSGHRRLDGVANVIVDEKLAARLALEHLVGLGHQRIAFFRGPPTNVDASFRWQAIQDVASEMQLVIHDELVFRTSGISYGEAFYREGNRVALTLLESGQDFTALFAFNDISAIGAIRGFLDAGLRLPDDVSVVGFDDIELASFVNPSLTTIRQPLEEMGETAGRVLLAVLAGAELPEEVVVEPKLIARGSTGPVRQRQSRV